MEEARSPLKEWIHKYSPSKSRNKPLPPPPAARDNPEKREFKPISGNAHYEKSLSKFRSLLKQKEHKRSSPPQRPRSRDKAEPRGLAKGFTTQRRVSKSKSVDLDNLSKKVSHLESQLKEARRELDRAMTPVPFGNEDELQEKKQRHSNNREKYDGLVENLLRQRDETYKALKAQSSADLRAAYEQYEPESNIDEDEHEPKTSQELHHKRKRSELREASWKQIQDHVEAEARYLKAHGGNSNARRAYSAGYDEPPPARRIKQVHDNARSVSSEDNDTKVDPPQYATVGKRHSRSFSAPLEVEVESTHKTNHPRPSMPKQRSASYDRTVEKTQQKERRQSHYMSRRTYENYEVEEPAIFEDPAEVDEHGNARPPSPARRHVPSPTRLRPVREEYEWDEEVF